MGGERGDALCPCLLVSGTLLQAFHRPCQVAARLGQLAFASLSSGAKQLYNKQLHPLRRPLGALGLRRRVTCTERKHSATAG